jgi:hypothetical protein
LKYITDLVCDSEVIEDFREGCRKVQTGVGLGNLNQIKQHTQRDPILLKMDGYSNISLGIWGRPSICSEAQLPVVFLVQSEYKSSDVNVNTQTDLKHFSNPLSYPRKNFFDVPGHG